MDLYYLCCSMLIVLGCSCLALAGDKLDASNPPSPYPIPKDMSKFMGDPDRGSEPTKAQAGQWEPTLGPVNLSKGHPFKDYGHFRMHGRVVNEHASHHGFTLDLSKSDWKLLAGKFQVKNWQDGKLLKYSILPPPADAKKPVGGWPLVVYCPGSGGVGGKKIPATGKPDPTVIWASDYYRKHFPGYIITFHPQKRTLHYRDKGEVELTEVLDMYLDVIDHLMKTEPIDKDRVYLMGFSMGGSSTWQLLLKRPELFAAASPAAGHAIKTDAEAKKIKDVPIWMFMGNRDPWSGSTKYIFAYQLLEKAGAKQVRFWEIQDMAHTDTPQLMIPVAEWLFAQQRNGKDSRAGRRTRSRASGL